MPQNSVYGIVQTADGYLWVATVDGLARFDGVHFQIFNKSNSPGIVNNRFISLFESAGGDLWAGTEESGATRFRQGRFEHFGLVAGIPHSVGWIRDNAESGGVVMFSDGQEFQFLDRKFSPPQGDPTFQSPERAMRSSNVKIPLRTTSDNKIFEWFIDGRWQNLSLPVDSPYDNPVAAAQEGNGKGWLITSGGRVGLAENGRITRFFDERDGLPKYALYFMDGLPLSLISKDADGSLWLVSLPSMQKELLFKKAAVPPPLFETEIYSAFKDGEGNLWFGSFRDGLFRARKQIIAAYSEAEGIADKNVYPIYEDRNGTIWVGTTSGLFKSESGTFVLVESTRNHGVGAIGEDAAGRLLISSGGLYVQANNGFVPFEREKITEGGQAIYTDRENTLWVGSGRGLKSLKDGVLTNFTTADGLAGNDVKVIIDARAGGLWIGTYDGLTRIENGKITSWREADGLPSRTVRALYEDADGTLWIGSYDGGLARFQDGKFTSYTSKTGLPNDGAFQILEDDNRNLWISSNRGIYRVKKGELNEFADGRRANVTAIAYGKSDGMLNAECNGGRSPAGIRARDGRLWFPTQDGVAVIDPREIKANLQPPPVVIENVRIDNTDSDFQADVRTDENVVAVSEPRSGILVEPSQQNFEISYTALSFINSESLRFKYKLEGLDDEWVDAGTRRQAYFSHVPPGSYTFRVIAANSDNVWNEKGASLKIVVLSPFYRMSWFLILTAFVIAAFAFLLFQRRVKQINLKHAAEVAFSRRLIDSQEQERKRFAAEMHDGLGQSLVIIKNRARLSLKQPDQKEAMLDHLESISETASHAIHEAKEIAFNLRPHLLDRLGLTKTIESMLEKVFGASGIELTTAVDQIDVVLEKDSEILLYRIVQECASNIVKHSQAENALIRIENNERDLTVKVIDDGRGFDPSAGGSDLSKRSFGLVGIAERTRLLGGKLNIESEAGKGTTVSIDIPVKSG